MVTTKTQLLNIRLDNDDVARLEAAAVEAGMTRHQLARMAIQNYLRGYRGPYVLRVPLEAHEGIG